MVNLLVALALVNSQRAREDAGQITDEISKLRRQIADSQPPDHRFSAPFNTYADVVIKPEPPIKNHWGISVIIAVVFMAICMGFTLLRGGSL